MRIFKNKRTAVITVLVLIIMMTGTVSVYAAFVYQSRAKRVISTKASEDLRFSSNIMTRTYDENEPAVYYYSVDEQSDLLSLDITVCNFAKGQMNYINPETIKYRFSAEIVPAEGYDLTDTDVFKVNNESFSGKKYSTDVRVLPADELTQHEYILKLPKSGNDWSSYSIVVKAIPENGSVVNGYRLCKKIVLTKAVVQTMGWKGGFTDSRSLESRDYYAFNYRISGGGNRVLVLSWNADQIELNPEFITYVSGTVEETAGGSGNRIKTLTFEAGKTENADESVQGAYDLQFYRIKKIIPDDEKWDDIESLVRLEVKEG